MGSICDTKPEVIQGFNINNYEPGSLDLENHNPLLDQLVVERYKSGVRINSKVRGFLAKKKFKHLKLLFRLQSKGSKETGISALELIPKPILDQVLSLFDKVSKDEVIIKYNNNLKNDLLDIGENPITYLINKNYFNKTYLYTGFLDHKTSDKVGFGVLIKFNNSKHEEILNDESLSKINELNENDIKEIDIGFFNKNIIAYGVRYFNLDDYYYGEFKQANDIVAVIHGKGFYSYDSINHNEDFGQRLRLNYTGQFSENMFHGNGLLNITAYNENEISCVFSYEGMFEEARMDGNGKIIINNYINGQIIELQGKVKHGVINGTTEFTFNDAGQINTYNGDVKNNQYNGRGIFQWGDYKEYKTTFDGDYIHNAKLSGEYSFHYLKEGLDKVIIYKGNFKDNLPSGDGSVYVNDFKRNNFVISTEEKDLVFKAAFYKGRLSRLITKNKENMTGEFEDFELLDQIILNSMKKENVVDSLNLTLLKVNGIIGSFTMFN